MANIDRNHMLLAFVWLIIGTLFGFWMGASNELQFRAVHVTMLLPGFVTLALYGAVFRLWPDLKASAAAPAQFWIAQIGQVLLVIGGWHFVVTGAIWLIASASAVMIAGALIMTWMFWSGNRSA